MSEQVSIMPCLDMQNGRVVKGVHFVDIKDAGDPVECAQAYCKAGDGARTGYDLPVIRAMAKAVSGKMVASGGAGKLEHFYDAVQAGVTILLAASVFHFRTIEIPALKSYLRGRGVNVN